MVTYTVDLKKLMKTTVRFLRRCDVPEHFYAKCLAHNLIMRSQK